MNQRLRISLLLMRLALGGFLLVWSLEKLLNPESTVAIFAGFYGMEISQSTAALLGIPQMLLSLAVMVGLFRTLTYGLAFLLHLGSTLASWNEILHPFADGNHLFLAGVPILVGFLVIFILREDDTLFSADARVAKKRIFSSGP